MFSYFDQRQRVEQIYINDFRMFAVLKTRLNGSHTCIEFDLKTLIFKREYESVRKIEAQNHSPNTVLMQLDSSDQAPDKEYMILQCTEERTKVLVEKLQMETVK